LQALPARTTAEKQKARANRPGFFLERELIAYAAKMDTGFATRIRAETLIRRPA
jgi:hypothetical protein